MKSSLQQVFSWFITWWTLSRFLFPSQLHIIHQQALWSLLSEYIPNVTICHHSNTFPLVYVIFIFRKGIIWKYNNFLNSSLPPTLAPIQLFTIQQQNNVFGSRSDYIIPLTQNPPVEQWSFNCGLQKHLFPQHCLLPPAHWFQAHWLCFYSKHQVLSSSGFFTLWLSSALNDPLPEISTATPSLHLILIKGRISLLCLKSPNHIITSQYYGFLLRTNHC